MRILSAIIGLLILLNSCSQKETSVLPPSDVDNGGLLLPTGFEALVVADSVGPTRHIAINSNGDIYAKLRIIEGTKGNVALRDTNGDGKADSIVRFGEYPNDGSFATEMRIYNGYLYFSSELVVYRQKLSANKLIPEGRPEIIVIDHNPLQWHNAKSIAFDHKGGMYVTFSAPTNACEDWNSINYYNTKSSAGVKSFNPCPELIDRGGIWRFDADKIGQRQRDGQRYATGLRSVVGIAWNTMDNALYGVIHGRDYLNSHAPENFTDWENAVLPAEEFVKIKERDDFGWPYAYYDPFKQKRMLAPEYGGDGEKEAPGYVNPLLGLPAHWAPNDLLFYSGDQFPERYKQGAFIAFHGSTNRSPYPQAGYIVAFIPFEDGKPKGKWEVFADGFAGTEIIQQMSDAKYRPMGLSEGPDGSLYISESKNGKIWRVMYKGNKESFSEKQLIPMEALKTKSYLKTPDEKQDRLPEK
jgi:glucose/arabinose dehydrogenase